MLKKPRRILLADDDATTSRLLESMLQLLNFDVDRVADGCELLTATTTTPYDLIILDIKSAPGEEVCVSDLIRLSELPLGRRTPIVALTACCIEECSEFNAAGGVDVYLEKPLELKQLLMVIQSLVSQEAATAPPFKPHALAVKPAAVAPDGGMSCKTGFC